MVPLLLLPLDSRYFFFFKDRRVPSLPTTFIIGQSPSSNLNLPYIHLFFLFASSSPSSSSSSYSTLSSPRPPPLLHLSSSPSPVPLLSSLISRLYCGHRVPGGGTLRIRMVPTNPLTHYLLTYCALTHLTTTPFSIPLTHTLSHFTYSILDCLSFFPLIFLSVLWYFTPFEDRPAVTSRTLSRPSHTIRLSDYVSIDLSICLCIYVSFYLPIIGISLLLRIVLPSPAAPCSGPMTLCSSAISAPLVITVTPLHPSSLSTTI